MSELKKLNCGWRAWVSENVKGYLSGGILAWSQAGLEVASVPQITVGELKEMIPGNKQSCKSLTCVVRRNTRAVTCRAR